MSFLYIEADETPLCRVIGQLLIEVYLALRHTAGQHRHTNMVHIALITHAQLKLCYASRKRAVCYKALQKNHLLDRISLHVNANILFSSFSVPSLIDPVVIYFLP